MSETRSAYYTGGVDFCRASGGRSAPKRRDAVHPASVEPYESLGRGRGEVWRGEGEAFLQKGSPSPLQLFPTSPASSTMRSDAWTGASCDAKSEGGRCRTR